jgi:apolipoprotein N-acyltransferase
VVRAGALQPGIPLDPSRPGGEAEAAALAALQRLDDAGDVALVVLPETFFPAAPGEGARRGEPRWSPEVDAALREAARRAGVPILTGAYSAGAEADRNAVFLVSPATDGRVPARGDRAPAPADRTSAPADRDAVGGPAPGGEIALLHEKEALVPGVEWLPAGGLERGAATFTGAGPGRPGILVCIESAWADMARRHALAGAGWLVNPTNDAWLSGPGSGPAGFALRQHPAHLQLRSLETGLGALRVGTTGLTGVTDPAGRWTPLLDPHRPGVAAASVTSLPGTTIFVRYGGWLAPVLSLAALAAALGQRLPSRPGPVDQGSSRV